MMCPAFGGNVVSWLSKTIASPVGCQSGADALSSAPVSWRRSLPLVRTL